MLVKGLLATSTGRHSHPLRPAPPPHARPARGRRRGAELRAADVAAPLARSEAPAPPPASSLVFTNLLMVWTQLSDRLSQSREGVFEAGLLLRAVKLAISSTKLAGTLPDGRMPVQRSIALAMALADCAAAGMPVDGTTIAAAVVADGVCSGYIPMSTVHAQLGMEVCVVAHEVQRVRDAARSLPLYDERRAGELREKCLALSDVRAILVEVVGEHDLAQHAAGLRAAKRQSLALRALQVFAPLGHALGLSAISSSMEDAGLRMLFPASFRSVEGWMSGRRDRWLRLLCGMRGRLLDAAAASPTLRDLGAAASVTVRAKSSVSTMKKLLELTDFERGGRAAGEVYDVLGMRVIVDAAPGRAPSLPELEAACHEVGALVATLWEPMPARRKDYISRPKANGYQSLHVAVHAPRGGSGTAEAEAEPGAVEVQIRSAAMHTAAEHGASAHFAYKGGLDREQTARLQDWTQQLMQAISGQQAATQVRVLDAGNAAHAPPAPAAGANACDVCDQPPLPEAMPLPPPQLDLLGGGGVLPAAAKAAVRELFDHIDRDGDGTLSVAELQALLRELGEEWPEAQAVRLAAVLASEPGGEDRITFDDLWAFMAVWGFREPAVSADGADGAVAG